MKKEFYETMQELDFNHPNLVMTVLEGAAFGEKALVSNQRLQWESKAGGFYTEHQSAAENICGSGIVEIAGHKVFCELLGQEKKMVVCGGGHVSIPIIQMGLMLGFHVTVLEDRPKFADHARQAGASEVFCAPFEESLKHIAGDEDTFFVIVTRGHRYDLVCLENIAEKPHAYIGMIGSRKRAALVKETVIANGGNPEIIQRVYTPIGLRIGAETPEEIAVSIMAEIVEVKNRKKRNGGYTKEILNTVMHENGKMVLATIIARKGSAPRAAGTKMLILPDGTCVGTIGGGCAEADILRKALLMIRGGDSRPGLCHVDMTGQDAEEEGMVCGGVIDVLMEVIS